jgi:predicted RNase H-related nuclease YkuK (DUF458 family)
MKEGEIMQSITYGKVDFDKMFHIIKNFVSKAPKESYNISVGTDSQNFDLTKVVLVVSVYQVGHGGIFFYEVKRVKKIYDINQKLFYETSISLELAMKLSEKFHEENFNYSIGIHVDAGQNGPTKRFIPEITSWVNACGFDCKTKPYSYAASTIANKYSK